MLAERRSRPATNGPAPKLSTTTDKSSVRPIVDQLADLDALAEELRGRFVVQVIVDADNGFRRTHVYRSCAAAERAVDRARQRGQTAHVSLVQMLPVGVVSSLTFGGAR